MTGETINPLIPQRERRRHARVVALSRLIKISARHEDSFAYCGDFSDGGMWLTSEVPLKLNQRIAVVFTPPVALEGHVVWVNDVECGIAFEEEVDSAALLSAVELRSNETGERGRLATAIKRNSDPVGPNKSVRRSRPGMDVMVLHPSGLERRARLNWAHHRVASVEFPAGSF